MQEGRRFGGGPPPTRRGGFLEIPLFQVAIVVLPVAIRSVAAVAATSLLV